METQFLKSFPDTLDWCYKDQFTIYLLQKSNQVQQSHMIVEILEIDLQLQTIRKQIEAPLFEGVEPDDCRYNILYCQASKQNNENQGGEMMPGNNGGVSKIQLIYPSNIIVSYDSESFELLSVVQSTYNIVCPIILEKTESTPLSLAFVDQTKSKMIANATEHDKLIIVGVHCLEELAKKQPTKGEFISITKCPFKSGSALITDIKQCFHQAGESSTLEMLLSFSNGKLWQVEPLNIDKHALNMVIGIDQFREQLGEQKVSQINCIDQIYVSQHRSSYILIGDAMGRLSIIKENLKNRITYKFLLHEQISYNQILSIKWLSNTHHLLFACITSDGQFQIQKAVVNTNQGLQIEGKCELKKMYSTAIFDEITNQFNFATQHLRQNQTIQLFYRDKCGFPSTIGVMWSERLLFKINKRTAEKKVILDKKLSLFKLNDQFMPMSKIGAPIIASQGAALDIVDLIPKKQEDQLISQPYIFFIDRDKSKPEFPLISAFQTFDGKKRPLIDIRGESGLQNEQQFDCIKLDIRPKVLEESECYRFLVQLEMSSTESSMCLCFQYDLKQKKLMGNVQQFLGIDCQFIGRNEWQDPAVCTLQEDQKTILIISLDPKLDPKLPRGKVQLVSKVKQIFWTPFCDGLALLYESLQEGLLRFSKNRLESNNSSDFSILAQSKYTLKLSFNEKVFAIEWTGFNSNQQKPDKYNICGAIATNLRIAIVDANLTPITQLNIQGHAFISSLRWLGPTLLFTTERHIMYLTKAKSENHGTLASLNCSNGTQILCGALSDRVILCTTKNSEVQFMNKQLIMLECLLLGYINSVPQASLDKQIIRNCLLYLDTSLISSNLMSRLMKLGLYNTANFILNNPQCSQQFEITQKLQVARALDNRDQIFDLLGISHHKEGDDLSNNIDLLKHKLKNDCEYQLEKSELIQQLHLFKKQGLFAEALQCAELLEFNFEIIDIVNNLDIPEEAKMKALAGQTCSDMCNFLEKQFGKRAITNKMKRYGIPDGRNSDLNIVVPEQKNREIKSAEAKIIDEELENLNRLNLGFDEAPFSQVVKMKHPQDPQLFQVKFMHSVVNDNLANWLGYDSLVSDNNNGSGFQSQPKDPFGFPNSGFADHGQEEAESKVNDEDGAYLSDSKASPEDFEERKHLFFYWRFDEGKSFTVNDMSDNEVHAQITQKSSIEWSEEPLEDGNPLDYEDKWGKQNVPSYAMEFDGFSGDNNGLSTTFSQSSIEKCRLSNNFTLEFWFKTNICKEDSSLMILHHPDFSIRLHSGRKITIETQKKTSYTLLLSQDPLSNKQWQHLAISNCATKSLFTVALNAQLIGSLSQRLQPCLNTEKQYSFFKAQNQRIQITEIRFWNSNIPLSIIKDNYKQPLAMLYEQKRAIKVKIKKKTDEARGNKMAGLKKPLNSGGGGGLKMVSQFDKKIKAQQASAPKMQENQEEEKRVEQNSNKVIEEEKKVNEFGFQMNIKNQEESIQEKLLYDQQDSTPIQDFSATPQHFTAVQETQNQDYLVQQQQEGFDFGFSIPTIIPIQSQQASSNFDFFGGFSSTQEVQQNAMQPSYADFNFGVEESYNKDIKGKNNFEDKQNSSTTLSDIADSNSKKQVRPIDFELTDVIEQEKPDSNIQNPQAFATQSPNISNDNSSPIKIHKAKLHVSGTATNTKLVIQKSSVTMIKPPHQQKSDSHVNEGIEMSPPIQKNVPRTEAISDSHLSSRLHQEESKVASSWTEDEDIVPEKLFQSIVDCLHQSKLAEADKLIKEGFIRCKQSVSSGKTPTKDNQNSPVKDKLKKNVRALATLKLANKLSLSIAQKKSQLSQVQQQLKTDSQSEQLQMQTDELQSIIASMSNMLIILQLPPSQEATLSLKRAFLQFALNQNIKIKNFSATSKIVNFYRKQVPFDQDEAEKKKIDQIEAMCKKYGEKNLSTRQGYFGADCPQCQEPLLFGHATPQCPKCKAKIGICYSTLRPVISDKAPRCHLCLARYHQDWQQSDMSPGAVHKANICHICQMSRVE